MWHNMCHNIVWKKTRSCYFLNCSWKRMCWTYCSVWVYKIICCVSGRNTLWGMFAALDGICTTNKSVVSTTRIHFIACFGRPCPSDNPSLFLSHIYLFLLCSTARLKDQQELKYSTVPPTHPADWVFFCLEELEFDSIYLSALSLSAEH